MVVGCWDFGSVDEFEAYMCTFACVVALVIRTCSYIISSYGAGMCILRRRFQGNGNVFGGGKRVF
jgi:hypothetical protein